METVIFALILYLGLYLHISVQRNTFWSAEFSYWLQMHLVFKKRVKRDLFQHDPITNRERSQWVEIPSQSSS